MLSHMSLTALEMELRIGLHTLVCLVFVVYATNASSSCLSGSMRATLTNTNTYAKRLKGYLGKCDNEDDVKKPMKSLRRHIEQVEQDIKLINSIYFKRQWTRYNGHCYYFSDSYNYWGKAKTYCEGYHSSLLKIDDKEEERWIQTKIDSSRRLQRSKANNYWIDLKAKLDKFYWTQDKTTPQLLSFEEGYPKSYDTDSHCVFLTQQKKWHNGVCNTSKQYICESDLCYR